MSILNPAYLPWIVLAALPVVIHLLTRRAVRVYSLPTIQFVQRAVAQQSRLFRVRHLLLLVIRVLIAALLVAVFMKPARTTLLGSARGKRTLVVVMDTSLSMGWHGGGASSFSRAQAQALILLDSLGANDSANVILADSAPSAVLRRPSPEVAALRQAIRSSAAGEERCDVPAAIALASNELARAAGEGPLELALVSDFQRTNWADARLDSLPPGTRVVYVGVDEGERENGAVTGIRFRPAFPRAGDDATALVEVWNGAPRPRTFPVTWRSGDAPPAVQNVTAAPFSSATASFPVRFERAGRYVCSASVPADSLPEDDTRWMVADLSHSLTVLLLTDEDASRSPSASYFLSRALNPAPQEPGGIRVIARKAAALTDTDLKGASIVAICGVQAFPADRLPLLAKWVQTGGALAVFLHGAAVTDQMAALQSLAPPGEGLPFLPTSPLSLRGRGRGSVSLSEARYDSRLLRMFKDPAAGDLGSVKFTRIFLTTEPDPRSELLLKFEDGTPAAARRPFGAGSVLVCNFSPAPAESDLARQPVFPPLMHEMLKGLAARDRDQREFTPGGVASVTLPAGARNVTVRDPAGRPQPAAFDSASGALVIDRAGRPGVYTATAAGVEEPALAVNTHPDESDLRTLDPRELQSRRDRANAVLAGLSPFGAARLDDLHRARPLWPWVLAGVLLLLAAEQWVASWRPAPPIPNRGQP